MRESVQVYFDKLTLGSVPAEITLKSGQVKPASLPVLSGEMHPLLRVFIPMRDNDDSVPKFVRTTILSLVTANTFRKFRNTVAGARSAEQIELALLTREC